jgi:hypothetical protein
VVLDTDPRKLRGRPRPVGFDVTDWRCGGAAHDAGFGGLELDGQGGVGDGDRDGLPGVAEAEAAFCPATMITPVAEARRWTRIGSVEGRGGGPAGRMPRSRAACAGVSGLGRVRSSPEGIPHPVRRIAAEQPQVAPEQAGHANCRV